MLLILALNFWTRRSEFSIPFKKYLILPILQTLKIFLLLIIIVYVFKKTQNKFKKRAFLIKAHNKGPFWRGCAYGACVML
jgi:hypothetical protein